MTNLAERLVRTRGLISAECLRLGRPEPTLIVVTKNHPVDVVVELYELGENNFGENRVQEATAKFQDFTSAKPESQASWHLIGQLQTNKVKQALEFVSAIHSLDRPALLDELAKRTEGRQTPLEVFIQVNLTEDPNRGGIAEAEVIQFADDISKYPSIKLSGLMAVASLSGEPERDFERVALVSQELIKVHPSAQDLSIGMSNDYLAALQFGATHLRIGSAITGNRPA